MIVRELLNKINGRNIKIGSKSGFVYCHTVDDETIETLEAISYDYKKKFEEQLKDVKHYLLVFDDFWKTELRKRSEPLLKSDIPSDKLEELKNEIKKEWEEDKARSHKEALNKKATLKEYLEKWKSFVERDVDSYYDSVDVQEPKGTIIIIVRGLENGAYWTTNEYTRSKNNG